MSEQKIEAFWRNANAADVARVMGGKDVEARFRDFGTATWSTERFLAGYDALSPTGMHWIASNANQWRFCQVYDPPQWYINKPDPGEGYRLLEKFPPENLQCNDEYWSRRENKWLPSPVAATGSHIQLNESWYRRRIEPVETVESKPLLIRRRVIEIGDEVKLPNGRVLVFNGEGFEVP